MTKTHLIGVRFKEEDFLIVEKAASQEMRTRSQFIVVSAVRAAKEVVS